MNKVMINTVYTQIYLAIEDFNQSVDYSEHLVKSPDTILYGKESGIGSLGLVTLLILIESKITEHFKKNIDLVSEHSFKQEINPFSSIKNLAEYIIELLK
nr:hypothetical protein [uncultured Carboxylicivirga sp.]